MAETTVLKSVSAVSRPINPIFYRAFSNPGRMVENTESIEVVDDRRPHLVVMTPAGKTVECDAVTAKDEPGRRVAWEAKATRCSITSRTKYPRYCISKLN
jgi:uncharacterized membrane protein